MNRSTLRNEIAKTQADIEASQELLAETMLGLSTYEIEEPYCYLLPALAFFIGYQLQDKITLAHASRYLLAFK